MVCSSDNICEPHFRTVVQGAWQSEVNSFKSRTPSLSASCLAKSSSSLMTPWNLRTPSESFARSRSTSASQALLVQGARRPAKHRPLGARRPPSTEHHHQHISVSWGHVGHPSTERLCLLGARRPLTTNIIKHKIINSIIIIRLYTLHGFEIWVFT